MQSLPPPPPRPPRTTREGEGGNLVLQQQPQQPQSVNELPKVTLSKQSWAVITTVNKKQQTPSMSKKRQLKASHQPIVMKKPKHVYDFGEEFHSTVNMIVSNDRISLQFTDESVKIAFIHLLFSGSPIQYNNTMSMTNKCWTADVRRGLEKLIGFGYWTRDRIISLQPGVTGHTVFVQNPIYREVTSIKQYLEDPRMRPQMIRIHVENMKCFATELEDLMEFSYCGDKDRIYNWLFCNLFYLETTLKVACELRSTRNNTNIHHDDAENVAKYDNILPIIIGRAFLSLLKLSNHVSGVYNHRIMQLYDLIWNTFAITPRNVIDAHAHRMKPFTSFSRSRNQQVFPKFCEELLESMFHFGVLEDRTAYAATLILLARSEISESIEVIGQYMQIVWPGFCNTMATKTKNMPSTASRRIDNGTGTVLGLDPSLSFEAYGTQSYSFKPFEDDFENQQHHSELKKQYYVLPTLISHDILLEHLFSTTTEKLKIAMKYLDNCESSGLLCEAMILIAQVKCKHHVESRRLVPYDVEELRKSSQAEIFPYIKSAKYLSMSLNDPLLSAMTLQVYALYYIVFKPSESSTDHNEDDSRDRDTSRTLVNDVEGFEIQWDDDEDDDDDLDLNEVSSLPQHSDHEEKQANGGMDDPTSQEFDKFIEVTVPNTMKWHSEAINLLDQARESFSENIKLTSTFMPLFSSSSSSSSSSSPQWSSTSYGSPNGCPRMVDINVAIMNEQMLSNQLIRLSASIECVRFLIESKRQLERSPQKSSPSTATASTITCVDQNKMANIFEKAMKGLALDVYKKDLLTEINNCPHLIYQVAMLYTSIYFHYDSGSEIYGHTIQFLDKSIEQDLLAFKSSGENLKPLKRAIECMVLKVAVDRSTFCPVKMNPEEVHKLTMELYTSAQHFKKYPHILQTIQVYLNYVETGKEFPQCLLWFTDSLQITARF